MQAPEKLEAARVRATLRRRLFGTATEPSRVGRYELLRSIGAGAMGTVFVARDTELEREVALKVLRTAEDADVVRRRLLREARAMARLRHPNVVTVFEAGVADDVAFIAMEYVDGTTLRGWLAARPRELAAIVEVFAQAARGLAAAHEAGLIHRDFKPDNVLIGSDGRAQVTDFGVARAVERPAPAEEGRTPGLPPTLTERARAGTPLYMAPEQHRGEEVDARTDQFAFCVALYEALAGEPPFAAETLVELAAAACRGEAQPLPDAVPGWLRRVVAVGLRPDPEERYRSMHELVEAMDARVRMPRSSWRRGSILALGGLAAIGLAVALGGRWGKLEVAPTSTAVAASPSPSASASASASASPTTSASADGAVAAVTTSASASTIGSIAIVDGHLAAGDPWLPGYRVVQHAGDVGLSWLDANARCRAASLALCTEAQWQRACEVDDRLASPPTWTSTADADRGFVVRGGGSCAVRDVAKEGRPEAGRGGICCSRSVAMMGDRSESADRIMSKTLQQLEVALGTAHIPMLESMAGDRVDHQGDAMSKDRFLAVLLAEARREPERWELHDTCDGVELPRDGERAWTAECRTLLYRGGRLGAAQRRYHFSGPHGTLSGVQEPVVLRALSAPSR